MESKRDVVAVSEGKGYLECRVIEECEDGDGSCDESELKEKVVGRIRVKWLVDIEL